VCYYTIKDNINYITLTPSNINPYLCTHIIIGFASIFNCLLDLGKDLHVYQEIIKLKKIHSNLKVMISVSNNNYGFNEMVLNHHRRKM
jgi:chitinase